MSGICRTGPAGAEVAAVSPRKRAFAASGPPKNDRCSREGQNPQQIQKKPLQIRGSLTKSLAAEWAPHGVRVNAVAPGYIETAMTAYALKEDSEMTRQWLSLTPMGRVGQPDEIASVVLFLASDASSYMTDSIVVADGDYTLW